MLGQTLVTHQTGPEGKLVSKVLIAKSVDIVKEYYFAVLFDRQSSCHAIIASTEGGMNIEEVAEKTPEKIFKTLVHPTLHPIRKLCRPRSWCVEDLRPGSPLNGDVLLLVSIHVIVRVNLLGISGLLTLSG
jgi:hypothetical protein